MHTATRHRRAPVACTLQQLCLLGLVIKHAAVAAQLQAAPAALDIAAFTGFAGRSCLVGSSASAQLGEVVAWLETTAGVSNLWAAAEHAAWQPGYTWRSLVLSVVCRGCRSLGRPSCSRLPPRGPASPS